jgi:hypothetical protein
MDLLKRRRDIDLLRVGAFLLLIFYHIGMVYVSGWGYHVKSDYQSESLAYVMLMVNQWRMPLLFVISGIATRYMMQKLNTDEFIKRRSFALLLPLLFGVLVIVPPQLYVEMLQKGDFSGNYWVFMKAFFTPDSEAFIGYEAGILPHIDVNHLWYLRELWVFTMLLVLLSPVLNHAALSKMLKPWCYAFKGWGILIVPVIIVIPQKALMDGQDEEFSRNSVYFVFFIAGYWLALRDGAWRTLREKRYSFLVVGLASNLVILFLYSYWPWVQPSQPLMQTSWLVISTVASWSWVMMLLGFGASWWRRYEQKLGAGKASQQLSYLSQAVYPYYILHQTLIVVLPITCPICL